MNTETLVKMGIDKLGFYELQPGVCIYSREEAISAQGEWHDGDKCKDFDFSGYPYWIIADDGATPEGFDSPVEAIDSVLG